MGNEEPWFVIGLAAITLLVIAIAIFIPVKVVQFLLRDHGRGTKSSSMAFAQS